MSRPDGPMLVLGVGNVLLRDDGVGVRVVEAMSDLAERGETVLPPDTSLVDGGTRGRDLLPLLADARAVVLVDALDFDGPPGTVEVLRGDALDTGPGDREATDRVGVGPLLETARFAGTLPGAVALVGIRPGSIEVGLDLTDAVRAAIPVAIEATLAELRHSEATAPSMAGALAGVQVAAEATA